MEKNIENGFNACMFREYCRSLKAKFQAAEEPGRETNVRNKGMDRLEDIKQRTSRIAPIWEYHNDFHWLITEIESLREQVKRQNDRDACRIRLSESEAHASKLETEIESLRKQLADYKAASESEDRWHKWAQKQIDDLTKQLAAKDAVICGMRETLEPAHKYIHFVKGWSTHGPATICTAELDEKLEQALSSSPTCPHKEELEKIRGWLADWTKEYADIHTQLTASKEEVERLEKDLYLAREAIDSECGYHRIAQELIDYQQGKADLQAQLAQVRERIFSLACSDHQGEQPKSLYCSTCGKLMAKALAGRSK